MKITFLTILILFLTVVVCYSDECEESNIPIDVAPVRLPVFILKLPIVNRSDVSQFFRILLNVPEADFPIEPVRDSLNGKVGSSIIEVSTKTRGIWFADKSQLWNTKLTPTLPSQSEARELSQQLLNKIYPPPNRSAYLSPTFSNFGKTQLARYEIPTKQRTDKQLDIQVNYVTRVKPFPDRNLILPVVGGGGEFNFTFGDNRKLIGHSGVWRDIKEKVRDYDIIPKAESDERFKKIMEKMHIVSFRSYLAYYLAPSFIEQEFLYPVYVYDAVAKFDNDSVHLKTVVLPATDFGPQPSTPLQAEVRDKDGDDLIMRPGSDNPEGDDKAAGQHEVGIAWNNDGLNNTGNDANGFLSELKSSGWVENFNFGAENAYERDWNKRDDKWVDAADFVYYSGHASMTKWHLHIPDGSELQSSTVGMEPESPGDLWGEQDLEWIIISACGPLQDDSCNGGGSVFDRWKGVFDGLHQLLGYGAIVIDWGFEGQKAAEYMKNGNPIIDSWFRAAREVQNTCNTEFPPDGKKIYAGAIYAEQENAGTDVRNDHLWGIGSVSTDPKPPDVLYALWTST